LYYAYKGFFESGTDTFYDIGFRVSADGGVTWTDESVFVGPDEQEEEAFEFPVVASSGGWTTGIHASYLDYNDLIFYHVVLTPPTDVKEFLQSSRGITLQVENPVLNSGVVRFALDENADVELKLFDSSGRLVRKVIERTLFAGTHEIRVRIADLPGGVYILALKAGNEKAFARFAVIH